MARIDPHDPRVADALHAYMTEVLGVCGMNGLSLAQATTDVADYCPPGGIFLVAWSDETRSWRAWGCAR